MSGGKPPYFIDKKGEVNELRALLRNHSLMRVASKKRDIIKKVDLHLQKYSISFVLFLILTVHDAFCLGHRLHDTRDRCQPIILGYDACKFLVERISFR